MSIPDQIFSRALKAGFTKEAACALLANIQAESAFNPINLEDSKERSVGMSDQAYTDAVDSGRYQNFVNDSCGYGLAQWTYGPRKRLFLEFCIDRGSSIGNFDTQNEFVFYELQVSFPGLFNKCKTSHDLEDLVHDFLYQWENPEEKVNNMIKRMGYATAWYQKYIVWENNNEEGAKMTKDAAIQKILTIARNEIGYHEKNANGNLDDPTANPGSGNYTKYARDLDRTNWYNGAKQGFPYCDVWYDWLFYKGFGDLGRQMICQPINSAGAGCLFSAQYYKQAGRWFTTPEVGDQIFFTYSPGEYSHTGIVERIDGNVVTTIEGNTSDQVARRQYQIGSSNIAGYGRPKWELAEGTSDSGSGGSIPVDSGSQLSRMLRKGMRGDDVKDMQEKLLKLGYDLGPDGADGDFGAMTELAVRKFQMDNSLEVDGIVGPESYKKLSELAKEGKPTENQNGSVIEDEDAPPPIGVTILKKGSKGNQVKLAQAALSCLGYSVSIDGIFGNEFENKIKAFQKGDGLEADGEIGEETWKKLLEIPFRKNVGGYNNGSSR